MHGPHDRSAPPGVLRRWMASMLLLAATALGAAGEASAQAAPAAVPRQEWASRPAHATQTTTQPASEPTTVVVLVRHAEKAGTTGDVPLSPAGRARATALARVLGDAGVQAVVTTQRRRTRETAEPLAAVRGLAAEVVPVGGPVPEHAERVAAAVRERHRGQVVLVVGHSNTIPAIIAALGGPHIPELCDAEYSNLFVLLLGDATVTPRAPADHPSRLVRGTYGAPDETGAGCRSMLQPK